MTNSIRSYSRKENHATVAIKANEKEFMEIVKELRRAFRRCSERPSYSITRISPTQLQTNERDENRLKRMLNTNFEEIGAEDE